MAYTVTRHVGLMCNRLECCLAYILLLMKSMLFVLQISSSMPFVAFKPSVVKFTRMKRDCCYNVRS